MASRFARPDTDTLTLKNGDTLVVKRMLNHGDGRKMRGMQLLPSLHDAAVVMTYLVDWSLKGLDGERVSIAGLSQSDLLNRIDALDDEDFAEIYTAITAHIDTVKADREQEKNGKDGEKNGPAISPSPSGVAGLSSGSESSILMTSPS